MGCNKFMKTHFRFILFSLLIICSSCNGKSEKEIKRLLNSDKLGEIIEGAFEAGESGDKEYVPLLLHNAGNPSVTSSLHFKGFSEYQEKMYALKKILDVDPPHPVIGGHSEPDSVNIKFYMQYWKNINEVK